MGSGAARASVAAGIASVLTLPLAVYLTRFSDEYELLHAGFAIPLAAALGALAVASARRSRRRDAVRLGPKGRGSARAGRLLGILGICVAASAFVAVAVYGLLEFVGSRG